MSAMREAFEKWYGKFRHGEPFPEEAFDSGWQSAIEHIKATGPYGYFCSDFDDGAVMLYEVKQESKFGVVYGNTPLYRIPEDV